MEGFVKFGTVAQIEGSVLTAGEYLKEKLLLNTPSEYFQGGIMVFNVSKYLRNVFSPIDEGVKRRVLLVLRSRHYE